MVEWVEIGNARLACGDCLDILPTLGKVDAVVTDPPYGIGDRMSGGTWGSARKYEEFRKWDLPPSNRVMHLVRRSAYHAVIWGGNYFNLPASRCWLSWSKVNAVRTMAMCELAWTNLDMPCKEWRGPVGSHTTGHPTQKPLALMVWSISLIPEFPQTILDPFMGSGTTGVACAKLGRKFIGIEIERRYFDVACARIEEAQKQKDLFIHGAEENPKPTQMQLLRDDIS